jgi:hypothetical protein
LRRLGAERRLRGLKHLARCCPIRTAAFRRETGRNLDKAPELPVELFGFAFSLSGYSLAGVERATPRTAEVVGLYMAPPENAIVISVDEKPSIQALERRQGYLKLPSGRALTGQSHDYKRHGTTTLFAALNVATGTVSGHQYKRRRRIEFLDFMNHIVAEHPGREIHVILDNLNTHKPKNDRWLKRHPKVHFHFTPTKASWLNQSLPPRRCLVPRD